MKRTLLYLIAAQLGLIAGAAQAGDPVEVMYFVTGKQGDGAGYLMRVTSTDPVAYQLVGETPPMHGVAINANGDMYAIGNPYNQDPQKLYKLDPATGAATTVGVLNGLSPSNDIIDLTFAGNILYGWDKSAQDLVVIDTATAEITSRTASGTRGSCTAIAWGSSDLLYSDGSGFGTINTGTGVHTQTSGTTDEDGYYSTACRKGGAASDDGNFYSIDGYSHGTLIRSDISNMAAVTEKQLGGLHSAAVGLAIGYLRDTDSDGVPDAFEVAGGSSKGTADDTADEDGDGISNYDEFVAGTDIGNIDTDGDSLADGDEIDAGTDPLVADTDGDTLPDGVEMLIGTDPLTGGVEDAVVADTDTDAGDLGQTGVYTDSAGNAHVFYDRYDDTALNRVLHYAMVSADGELVIAPSVIETTLISDYPRRMRPFEFSDGTIGVVWSEDGYLIYARVDPSEAPQDGTAVDVSKNTAFLPVVPTILEDGTPADIYATHPFPLVDNDTLYVVFPDDNNSNCLSIASFDQDGAIGLDVTELNDGGTYCDDRGDPYAVMDADGRLHIAFQNGDNTSDYEIHYAVVDPTDGSFIFNPVLVSKDDGTENMRPRLVAVGDEGKLMLSYGDKTERSYTSYGGGDIMYYVFDPDAVITKGSFSGQTRHELNLRAGYSKTWYYEASRDADGNAALLLFGHGGGTDAELEASQLYLVRVDEDGNATPPFVLTDRAMADDYGYHWFGGIGSSHMSYVDGSDVMVRSYAAAVISGDTDAAGVASLSKGYFLTFAQQAEADLPADAQSSLPEGYDFNDGFVSFAIGGLTPGDTVVVTLNQPNGVDADARYFKYDATNGWYAHGFNDIGGDQIEISLTDGGTGDADGMANGTILDPGGLGTPVVVEPPPAPTPVNVSGGGGGGCVIGDGERPMDPLFPALLALAGAYLVRRRMAN